MTMTSGSAGPGSKSPVKIIANIFISFIGAGVLGLPYAFKEAGIIEGFVIMTLVGMISVKAMMLIIDCKYILIQKDQPTPKSSPKMTPSGQVIILDTKIDTEEEEAEVLIKSTPEQTKANGVLPAVNVAQVDEPTKPEAPGQDLNYGDVGYYALGNIGRFLVELSIIVSQIGFCCAYLIFISENLADYIQSVHMVQWLAILLPPLALLSLVRHLGSLAWSSMFAQVSNLMAFAVVFWFDFEHFSNVQIQHKTISIQGFPFFLAVAIYCYEGAGMILSLDSSLHKEVRHTFKCYFKLTLSLVTLLYISFGVCGYLSFGAHTNAVITLNLPKGEGIDFAVIVKCCLCIGLFFTYPVMMFPVVDILERKLLPNPEKTWQGNLLRFGLVGLTGLVVLAVPNFANLMALVGSSCCTLLAFVLPGLFHLQIYRKYKGDISRSKLAFDVFLIVLGIVGAIVGTCDALVRLKETHTAARVIASSTAPPTTSANTTVASTVLKGSRHRANAVKHPPGWLNRLIKNTTSTSAR